MGGLLLLLLLRRRRQRRRLLLLLRLLRRLLRLLLLLLRLPPTVGVWGARYGPECGGLDMALSGRRSLPVLHHDAQEATMPNTPRCPTGLILVEGVSHCGLGDPHPHW